MDLGKEKLKEVSELAIKVFMEYESPNESQEGIRFVPMRLQTIRSD